MAFLDPRREGGRHDKRVINESGQFASRSAGPGHGDESAFTGCCDALQDIGRVPARADANGDVSFAPMGSYLASEQLVIPIVIRNTCNSGDIRCQGDRGERRSVALITSDEFGGDVRGICRASAVAEEQNLVAAVERICDEPCNVHDAVSMFACKLLFYVGTVCKGRQHNCLHVRDSREGGRGCQGWRPRLFCAGKLNRDEGRWYSRRAMAQDQPIKALVVALVDDAAAAVYSINRLKPEALCFVLPEGSKALVESAVQPNIEQMPKRWDWIVLEDVTEFSSTFKTLAHSLPELLRTWAIHPGELVVDMSGAKPAMAAALTLVAVPWTSRVVALVPAREGQEDDRVELDGKSFIWTHSNPWDEQAAVSRRDGCELFNRGLFPAAAKTFRDVEVRVSGGQKPLYRAFADLAEGYDLWERFHYRQAWEKLKTAVKALEMASLWGGPPGLKAIIPPIKANAGFLEKLVLDPAEVKESLILDLLASAGRRLHARHDPETAMAALVRALEVCAQVRLYKSHKIKSWDAQPGQLPAALQEVCQTCYLEDIDGKYKLPLQAQYRVLAGLGDQLGQGFLREWPKMKPLLDAANHAVLGHGFEPIKSERVQQLYEVVLKLTGVPEASLPKFPVLSL